MKAPRVPDDPPVVDRRRLIRAVPALAAGLATLRGASAAGPLPSSVTHYHTKKVGDVNIFYREAGPPSAPVVLLLHGFPTSSHMFRNLIPALSDRYHVIAPDYPGFGQSDMPDRASFAYTFDRFGELVGGLLDRLAVARYAMYVMDYGAPVGWRIALKHPERVTALIVQNGNAYEEGLKEFWDPIKAYWSDHSEAHRKALYVLVAPETTKFQYTDGVSDVSRISPDNWSMIRPCSIDRATPRSRWTCSTTTAPTCRSIQQCRPTSENTSRRPSSSGEKTTRSSRPMAHTHTSATSGSSSSTSSTRDISLWRTERMKWCP